MQLGIEHLTAAGGDSGAAVYDDDGLLWGIIYGGIEATKGHPTAYITAIHTILAHVKETWDVDLILVQ